MSIVSKFVVFKNYSYFLNVTKLSANLLLLKSRETRFFKPEISFRIFSSLGTKNKSFEFTGALYSSLSNDKASLLRKVSDDLFNYIEKQQADLALENLNKLSKGIIRSLPLKLLTDLVVLCMEKNELIGLSANDYLMQYIIENSKYIFPPILKKYSDAGDLKKIIVIKGFMPDFTLRAVEFNKYFVKALNESKNLDHLMAFFEERFDSNMLISIDAFEALLKVPEFEIRLIELARKFLENNFHLPVAAVWSHFFVNEIYWKAEKLLCMARVSKFEARLIEVANAKILKVIRKKENISMAYKFLVLIRKMELRYRMKERVYGTVLEVLVKKFMYHDAVTLVLDAETNKIELNKNYRSSLLSLRKALEKNNIPIAFVIPP